METTNGFQHVKLVMGTTVGIRSPDPLLPEAVDGAVTVLQDADRIFSLWNPDSPMSRVRAGRTGLGDLWPTDAADICTVLSRCQYVRDLTDGAFDPWAMPGGVDPTGLVKGWAVARARDVLVAMGQEMVMVNGGGDIAVAGLPYGRPWRVGIRHPFQPTEFAAVIEVADAVATSGNYERPGELLDPSTGRAARGVASATVVGTCLDIADALATACAVRGAALLDSVGGVPGFGGYLISDDGRCSAGGAVTFVSAVVDSDATSSETADPAPHPYAAHA